MAKMYGLGGVLSGKLGSTVLAVRNGVQIARQYQPVVANPKSNAQLLQRAKANMVGRLSSVVPKEVLLGLGNSSVSRRSRFLKLSLRNATSSVVGDEIIAKIQPNAITFSEGAAIPVIGFVSAVVDVIGGVTITMHRQTYVSASDWDNKSGIFVALAIDPETGYYDYIQYALLNKPAVMPPANENFTQVIGMPPVSNHDIYVYFIPFDLDAAKASTITKGLAVSDAQISAGLFLSSAEAYSVYGHSEFLGQATLAE